MKPNAKILLACLAVGVGCQNSQNSPPKVIDLHVVADVTSSSSFHASDSVAESENAESALTCSEEMYFDSRVEENDSGLFSFVRGTQLGTLRAIQKLTIKDRDESTVSLEAKTLSFELSQAGGEVLNQTLVQNQTCSENEDEGDLVCKLDSPREENENSLEKAISFKGMDLMREKNSGVESVCELQNEEVVSTAIESGSYELREGRKIEALRKITQLKGLVVCGGRAIGDGSATRIEILSPELKNLPSLSTEITGCGYATVMSSEVISWNEQILESTQFEWLQQ